MPDSQGSQIVTVNEDLWGRTALSNQLDLCALQSPIPANAALLLPQDHFSCLQVEAVVVAGALGQGHTAALLIQVGVVRAATAIHRCEVLETVGVPLRERTAGLLAGG
jgi:hypothetical protein